MASDHDERGAVDRALSLLRHSARVSPILRDAVDEVEAEVRRLRGVLDTAWLMVKNDATDAPGRISTAIRPYLEAQVSASKEVPDGE